MRGSTSGGSGVANSITGTSVAYAGGGGTSSRYDGSSGTYGRDGGGSLGGAGTAFTGGGGSGGQGAGGAGGSGIVVVKSPTAASSTTGSPTVITSVAGYYIYRFTATGTITF